MPVAALHMADGSELEVIRRPSPAAYEDGIVKRYFIFALTTIDPDDVVSITLFDGSYRGAELKTGATLTHAAIPIPY